MKDSLRIFISGLFLLSLSSAMAAETDDMKASVRQACQQDLEQYCKNVTPGDGREGACLKAYEDKLSAGCKQEWQNDIQQFQEMMKNMQIACGEDIQKFCQESEEDVMTCLKKHTSEISSACKTFSENQAPQT